MAEERKGPVLVMHFGGFLLWLPRWGMLQGFVRERDCPFTPEGQPFGSLSAGDWKTWFTPLTVLRFAKGGDWRAQAST